MATLDKIDEETAQKRYKALLSVAHECITEQDLLRLVSNKPSFRLYDGFEPSGRIHIAQGVFRVQNVNKCTRNGGVFVFWVADWFALMNDKMGGDLDKIKVVGQYFIEVWKAAGMEMENVEFRWASQDIINDAKAYWGQMLDIAKRFTVARIVKCGQIMGRAEGNLTAAQILYPLMQCTDIFFLKANICQLGLDQRKVNMLARDYCDVKKIKNKPVILSHQMISGLKQGQAKMSKSDPDSAIFMEDSLEDITRKINGAFCPNSQVDAEGNEITNPCLDYVKNICLNSEGDVFIASGVEYQTIGSVSEAFFSGKLSESDLKAGLISNLDSKILPVRTHFQENDSARELLKLIKQYKKEALDKTVVQSQPKKKLFTPDLQDFKSKVTGCNLIILPILQSVKLSVSDVFNTLKLINSITPDSTSQIVIYIPDLSATCCNSFSADRKTESSVVIKSAYSILVSAIKSQFKTTSQNSVEFIWQSELMLKDVSNYWINAINAGRSFQLSEVLKSLNASIKDSNTPVGPVISTLILSADVVAIKPHKILSVKDNRTKTWELIQSYCKTLYSGTEFENSVFEIIEVNGIDTQLLKSESRDPNFMDDDLLITDSSNVDVKRKIKRAFCEPGNAEFNPPLVLAKFLGLELNAESKVSIGEKEYKKAEDLEADYVNDLIHPKDLKALVTQLVQATFKEIEASLKQDEVKKELSTFQKYSKKILKKK